MSKVKKVRLEGSTEEGADKDYAALEKAPGIESRVDVDLEQDPLAAWEDQFLPYQLGPRPVFPTLVNNCSEIPFQQEGWVFSRSFERSLEKLAESPEAQSEYRKARTGGRGQRSAPLSPGFLPLFPCVGRFARVRIKDVAHLGFERGVTDLVLIV